MKRISLLIFGFICCLCTIQAAKTKTIKAEYIYYAPENVTVEQAKQTALQRARLQGLAEEFGTNMRQDILTILNNINGESNASVFKLVICSVSENLCLKINCRRSELSGLKLHLGRNDK